MGDFKINLTNQFFLIIFIKFSEQIDEDLQERIIGHKKVNFIENLTAKLFSKKLIPTAKQIRHFRKNDTPSALLDDVHLLPNDQK